jgi:hypothetical protein
LNGEGRRKKGYREKKWKERKIVGWGQERKVWAWKGREVPFHKS